MSKRDCPGAAVPSLTKVKELDDVLAADCSLHGNLLRGVPTDNANGETLTSEERARL